MTAKYSSEAGSTPAKGIMSSNGTSAWNGIRSMVATDEQRASRDRMNEARGDLMRIERQFVNRATEAENAALRQVAALERQAEEVRAQAWAIEREAESQASVLRKQAKMEADLANRIRDIAERSALLVLDRIKEASDSMMDWAGLMGGDLSEMLKKEAAEQVSRKVADIQAVHEAMEDEARAVELLELASRYRDQSAA